MGGRAPRVKSVCSLKPTLAEVLQTWLAPGARRAFVVRLLHHTRVIAPRKVPQVPPGQEVAEQGRTRRYNRNRRSVPRGYAHRVHAPAAGGRHPLRPPDAPLESQDAPLHLCRAQRDPHHRPCPDGQGPRRGARVRARDRRPGRHDPVRRHQEAGPGADLRRGHAGRDAVRQPALAGRHADQLRHHPEAARPARSARGTPGERRVRAALKEGSQQAHR